MLKVQTTLGSFSIELHTEDAPITCANFLKYVDEEFYAGTIFHRVIPGFMIQGGGMLPDMKQKKTNAPIKNEAANGLKNRRGSLSMARTQDPHSATSQFFVNVADNAFLDQKPGNPGYAVFAHVIEGMSVVDKIVAVPTTSHGHHDDVPVDAVLIESITRVAR